MPSGNTTNLGIRSFFNWISSCFFHPLNHHSHTAPGGSRAPPSPAAIEEKPFESDSKESSRGDEPCSATFSDSESCSICLNEFNASGMALKILPKCGHVFHKACIDEWLPSRSLNCPLCRDRAADDKLIRKSRPRDEVLHPMTALTLQFSSRAASTRTSRRHFYAL